MKIIRAVMLASIALAPAAAFAQASGPNQSEGQLDGQRGQVITSPRPMGPTSSDTTGTLPDKRVGPARSMGNSPGPDGTPGNGSPSKQDGSQE